MNRSERNRRRQARKAKQLRQMKSKLSHLRKVVEMGEGCPNLDDFIASLDTSDFTKLLGIFPCPPERYLATEAVLVENGYPGYQVLQCQIEGERPDTKKQGPQAWAAAVKKDGEQDEEYRTFVGIVRRPPAGDSTANSAAKWGEIIAVAHELGHVYDMELGIAFQPGNPFDIMAAELHAHQYACRLLAEREIIMGLTAYLSMCICAVADDPCESTSQAATAFMNSEQYRECLRQIPPYVQRQFELTE